MYCCVVREALSHDNRVDQLSNSSDLAADILADLFFVEAANSSAERYRAIVRGDFHLSQSRQVSICKEGSDPLLQLSIRRVDHHSVTLHGLP
jgi:hypothetical protein